MEEFDFVGIPLSVEVIVGFCWYPSKCRGDCGWSVGFEPYPSSVR